VYSSYVRNIANLRDPAIVHAARLMPNAVAKALFVADPSARQACDDAVDAVLESGEAQTCDVGGKKMVFFPVFNDERVMNIVVGCVGSLENIPRLLHELGRGLPHFSELLNQMPTAVLTARPNGQIDYLSRRWYEVIGIPSTRHQPEDAIFSSMLPDDYRDFSVAWTTGIGTAAEFVLAMRLQTPKGPRAFELRVVPVRRAGRAITKWVGSLTDVEAARIATNELTRLAHRFEILAAAGSVIASAQTIDEVADGLTQLSNVDAGERWFIELRDLDVEISRGDLAKRHAASIEQALNRKNGVVSFIVSERLFENVLYVAAPVVVNETSESYGYIGFAREDAREPTEEDLILVSELGARAALAVERVLVSRRDQELAQMLQRSMLPLALPYSPGIRLDVAYEAAEYEALVGGDWYDAFELPDERIAIAIGDVAGHGFDSAIVMNQVRQSMRTAAYEDPDPYRVLQRANRTVNIQMQPMVTAFFGVLDPLTLRLTFASAGHLPPIFVDESGRTRTLRCEGTPLGIGEDVTATTMVEELAPGGALVLYTDGIVEDERDPIRGEQALRQVLSDWAKLGFVARASQLQSLLRTGDHRDDAAMFILRFPHADELDVRAPATPKNAQRLRHAARRFVAGSAFEEGRAYDAVLAIGEALNNAVVHAYAEDGGFVHLLMKRDSRGVIAEVRDEGSWLERKPYDRMHGLGIIETLAERVDIATGGRGTAVRMQLAYAEPRLYQVAT
jgi:anti-sigma regulatory factor (Ser/Thr protein kinase)/PAS domain-containing protein